MLEEFGMKSEPDEEREAAQRAHGEAEAAAKRQVESFGWETFTDYTGASGGPLVARSHSPNGRLREPITFRSHSYQDLRDRVFAHTVEKANQQLGANRNV